MLRINFVTYKECLYKECHGTTHSPSTNRDCILYFINTWVLHAIIPMIEPSCEHKLLHLFFSLLPYHVERRHGYSRVLALQDLHWLDLAAIRIYSSSLLIMSSPCESSRNGTPFQASVTAQMMAPPALLSKPHLTGRRSGSVFLPSASVVPPVQGAEEPGMRVLKPLLQSAFLKN